jgi:hypothetical protein
MSHTGIIKSFTGEYTDWNGNSETRTYGQLNVGLWLREIWGRKYE